MTMATPLVGRLVVLFGDGGEVGGGSRLVGFERLRREEGKWRDPGFSVFFSFGNDGGVRDSLLVLY